MYNHLEMPLSVFVIIVLKGVIAQMVHSVISDGLGAGRGGCRYTLDCCTFL